MKARHIQNGHVIDYTNGTEAVIEPGTLVMIGTVPAVAADKIEVGQTGSCYVGEVYELEKDNSEVTQGASIYYSATAGKVTTTSTSNTLIGYAFYALGSCMKLISVSVYRSAACTEKAHVRISSDGFKKSLNIFTAVHIILMRHCHQLRSCLPDRCFDRKIPVCTYGAGSASYIQTDAPSCGGLGYQPIRCRCTDNDIR